MTKKTENGLADSINIAASSITVPTAASTSPITVTVTPFDKEPLELNYDPSTPSGEYLKDSLHSSGINLEKVYIEKITETVEVSKGLIDGGFVVALTLPEKLGGVGLKIERLPKSKTRTIKKIIYKPSKK